MKAFFTKKRIAFLTITSIALLILIILLIVPIGSVGNDFLVYCLYHNKFETCHGSLSEYSRTSPFTMGTIEKVVLFGQTIVFTLVGIIFVVFFVLFMVELKKAGAFNRTHRPTRAERLQAQVDELQKQVDELKKGE